MKTDMPWDEAIKPFDEEEMHQPLKESETNKDNGKFEYGQGKPRREYIVGDITSDKD